MLWQVVQSVAGAMAGKTVCLTTDENHDLIVIASSQGSIVMFTLRTLPWSKDVPDPPSPRGFLPVDPLSLVDVIAVDAQELEESQKHAQVPFFYREGSVVKCAERALFR